MMSEFKVGDRIVIKEGKDRKHYRKIHNDSFKGVIIEIGHWHYINFDNCNCGKQRTDSGETACIGFAAFAIERVPKNTNRTNGH